MFSKVIIGVDRPSKAHDAIAFARAVAPQGELLLATVYPYDEVRRSARPDVDEPARERIARGLAELRDTIADDRIRTITVPAASSAEGLRTLAAEQGADLVVVGSSDVTRFGALGLGDVSRAVLHGTSCPVAVIPHGLKPIEPPHTIGVAFDRSPESQAALDVAVGLARATNASLILTAAIDVQNVPEVAGFERERALDDLCAGAERHLREIAADLPVPARVHVEIGPARLVLAHLTADCSVLVTGSRGWGPVARVTLGSTSDWLIHHVRCPVVVVPKPADDPAQRTTRSRSIAEHDAPVTGVAAA